MKGVIFTNHEFFWLKFEVYLWNRKEGASNPLNATPPPCHQKGVELFSQAGATHFHGWKQFGWMDSPVRYGPTPNRPPLAINTRAFPKSMQICHLIGTKLKGQTLPKICKCKKSFYFYRGLPRMAVMAQAIKDVWTCLQQTCFAPAQGWANFIYVHWRRIKFNLYGSCKGFLAPQVL